MHRIGQIKESSANRLITKMMLLVLTSLVFMGSSLFASQETKSKNVLVLASYNPTSPVGFLWNEGIRTVFNGEKRFPVDINIEYLDLTRFKDDQYVQMLLALYGHKYSKAKPDLIIPIYNGALGFLLKHGQDLFPGVPIAFAGVAPQFVKGRNLRANITGLLSVNGYGKTLELALDLQPNTRHVAVVSGAGIIGNRWGNNAWESFRHYEERVDFIDLRGLPMQTILDNVSKLPPQTVVMYITLLEDGEGENFTAPEALSRISRSSSAPVYSFWDLMLGHGIVGGYLSSTKEKGKEVAKLGLEILNGEKVENIPLREEAGLKYMFDWRELKRWSIPKDKIPAGSIVEFKESNFWELYKGRILIAAFLILFEALLIFYLLLQRRIRRVAEKALGERLRFEALVSGISAKFVDLGPWAVESKVETSLKEISDFLGFDRSTLFQYSEDLTKMAVVRFHPKEGIQPPPQTISMDQFPWITKKTLNGEIISFSDPSEMGEAALLERRYFEDKGIRGAIVVPLSISGSPLGLISFAVTHSPQKWSKDIVQRLRLVAEIFANALMRKRSEKKMIQAELKYRTVAEYTYDWEYWEDENGTLKYVSPSCERITGYTAEAFLRDPSLFQDIIFPGDREKWDNHHSIAHQQKKAETIQFRIERRDGKIRWIEHACQLVTDHQGDSLGFRASNRDITARKKQALEIEERLAFEELISKVSSELILVPFNEVDSKIQDMLSRAGKFMHVDRAYFFQFNSEKTEFRISHLWEAEGIHKDQTVRGGIVKEQFPWLAENLLSGRDIIISNVEEFPFEKAPVEYRYCLDMGIQAFLILPIHVQDSPLCAIGLDSIAGKRSWPQEIQDRLKLIGENLAGAIARNHSESALKGAYAHIKKLKERVEAESAYLQEEIKLEHNFENIIGQSEALKYVLYQVEQVASTDSSVLILGETGTGKELVARAIHKLSPRGKRALVKVNCAALPGELVESELFGREKGAFTGATTGQIGRFELAGGSTLFLDEIGEMPLPLQAKLLRVLESGEFERLGNPKTFHSDARIIASTNRSLEEEVRKGTFREDLWYRLKVFTITQPPLRKRPADIPLLIQWFMENLSRKMGKPATQVSSTAMEALKDYHWPGNVRELEHMVESALITARGKTLKLEPPQTPASNNAAIDFPSLEEMERQYILKVLDARKWKIQGEESASSVLKMHPNTLRARMKKLGISKPV